MNNLEPCSSCGLRLGHQLGCRYSKTPVHQEQLATHLTAAAPEMLAMLEHVLANWFPPEIETGIGPVSNSEEINKLVNLIKKAKGE